MKTLKKLKKWQIAVIVVLIIAIVPRTRTETEPVSQLADSTNKEILAEKTIDISLDVEPIVTNGKITVNVKTNLPDKTKMAVSFKGSGDNPYSSDTLDLIVSNGECVASELSNNGEPLTNGDYELTVTSTSSAQDSSVLSITGEHFENLKGDLVNKDTVKKTLTFTVEDGISQNATKTLGFTLDTFTTDFNKNMLAVGSQHKLAPVEQKGSEGYIVAAINDYLVLSFWLSSNTDEISTLAFIGAGDGTIQSGKDVIYGMIAVVMTVDSTILQDDATTMLLDMLNEEKGDTRIVNGIKYTLIPTDEFGTFLTVAPLSE